MQPVLPLDRMTTAEKLEAMELLWADLAQCPADIPSPAWHADVLRAREDRVRMGISKFSDWSEAKRRILERTR